MRQRKGIWRVCVWLCHSKQGASVTQRVTGRTVSAFPGCAGCGESLTLFVSQDHGVKFQPVTDGVTEMFSSRKKLQFCAVVTFLSHTLYCCPPFPVPPPCWCFPESPPRDHFHGIFVSGSGKAQAETCTSPEVWTQMTKGPRANTRE